SIVDRHAALGWAAVGGVEEECRTAPGNLVLVDAHHDRMLVLRDLQVFAVGRAERALRLLADLHRVEGGAVVVTAPPVVGPNLRIGQPPTGIRRGAEGGIEGVPPRRGGGAPAPGLRRHARRTYMGGDAGLERLPTGRGALIDIHLRVGSAGTDDR